MGSMSTVSDQLLLARAYLSRVSEPGCISVWDLVRREGAVAAARALRTETATPGALAATAARRRHADPHVDLEAAERCGLRLVVPESDQWPHFALGALERTGVMRLAEYRAGQSKRNESGEPIPPLALWVRGNGDLTSLGVRSAGIVGSRAATQYGERVTSDLSFGLASSDVVIVSGGAYGIDAIAHRAALAAHGQTVLVSAGGLDRPYPAGNSRLYDQVIESGLVISESPPGCAPQRHRFLTRNRLIAAFSTGVVVVEAAYRSGARNTASHCVTLQRPLMAVPGPIDSAMSVGCHEMIRRDCNPALLVSSVDDILAVVGGIGETAVDDGDAGAHRSLRAPVTDVRAELDLLQPTARLVFDGLQARKFARPDEIAARCGVSPIDVIRALPVLELANLIEAGDGGHRLATRLQKTQQ